MQKNLKLVSARIDPDALDKIEKFVRSHTYWTKNAVINGIITAVMTKFDERDIYDMVRTNFFINEDITAVYRINRAQVAQKDSQTQ
jgi:hypothetical protein